MVDNRHSQFNVKQTCCNLSGFSHHSELTNAGSIVKHRVLGEVVGREEEEEAEQEESDQRYVQRVKRVGDHTCFPSDQPDARIVEWGNAEPE